MDDRARRVQQRRDRCAQRIVRGLCGAQHVAFARAGDDQMQAARAQQAFGLWFWSGQPDAPARRVSVAGLPGFERAEGLSPAVLDGKPKIVIVSDDGNRKEGRFARFLVLDPAQLQIAP